MITFLLCCVIIVGGYFTYSKLVENIFGPDDRETPAVAINDGVDYVVMPQWKMFMIQLLNIAGLGPINGALGGAFWGPAVYLWITFGTVFAGCVHDYFSGMLSERNNGASISEVINTYLGKGMGNVMRAFSVVLLIMVGTVFAVGPAGLLRVLLTRNGADGSAFYTQSMFWLIIILVYYFISTFVPIDKVIGRIYPVFGICLIVMAVGVGIGILRLNGADAATMAEYYPSLAEQGYSAEGVTFVMPELWDNFTNLHPKGTPIWSTMFITVACGALSGFHATQSPMMARCLKSERQGRFVFSGAMTAEGIIAMVWGAAGCTFFGSTGMNAFLADTSNAAAGAIGAGNGTTVYNVSVLTMGGFGAIIAMLGVIACPITSGDTAFRSARLTLADWFKVDQGNLGKRLSLTIPVLGVGAFLGIGNSLGFINYDVIWRYFSWTNQTLAMIVLWAAAMYLAKEKKNFWVCALPATFMSAVSITYFCMAGETLGMIEFFKGNTAVAYPAGIIAAALFFGLFWWKSGKYRNAEATA
ncbi:MAG: carbon starvation protein A [Lachnospiraceae bacterium]|nr:carbon starvation protein A [Lachnospiraceae bacterium]